MFFPKETQERGVSDDGRVFTERPVGHEYVNGHSDVLVAVLKMNHDIKLLGAREGLEKGYYMMKYSTKDQQHIENQALIQLNAYDVASRRFGDNDDPVAAGTKQILSMLSTLTNAQEVTAPMAGLFIERESLNYSSHEYVKVSIATFISALEKAPCTYAFREGDNPSLFEASSPFHDYVRRPDELEATGVFTYATLWQKKRGLKGLKLQADHAHFRTQTIHKRDHPACFTPTGCRLPNVNDPELSEEKRLFYIKFLMVAFKPFRSLADLLGEENTWQDVFPAWWRSDEAQPARVYSDRALDYYAARQEARQRPDHDINNFNALEHGENNDGETLNYDTDPDDADEAEDIQFQADVEETELPQPVTKYAQSVQNFNEAMDMVSNSSSVHSLARTWNRPDAESIRQEMEEAELRTTPAHDVNQAMQCPSDDERNTRVSILSNADMNPPWVQSDDCDAHERTQIPLHAQLQDVSRHHRLNKRQHEMFVLAGSALLREFQIEENCATTAPRSQFRGFLAGLPGAGKSQVIKAIQDLARAWNRSEAVKTLAFQGVAAQAANGETIHRCFGWRLKGITENWRPNQAQQEKFAAVKLIIIDEISTTDAKFIGQMDICLRRIRQNDEILGGIHTLFVGDWLQQLPVAGAPAFTEVAPNEGATRESNAYLQQLRGSWVYHKMQTVVILDENMRHRRDPQWAEILDRWRFGNYLQEDLDTVNAACHERDWRLEDDSSGDPFCPIIVSSNQLRYEFNQEALRRHCEKTGTTYHRFPAKLSRTRGSISAAQHESLQTVRDDKTSNLPINLDLALGMPVQCTKNISRILRLANGTIGHVVDIVPNSTSAVTIERDTETNRTIHAHNDLPAMVLVKLRGYEDQAFLPSLPHGVVPLYPYTQRGVTIQLPNRSFNVNIVQVPLIPAYALTSDKSQGLTVSQMVLGPLRHETRKMPQRAAHYVATTRVRTMKRLLLMEPLKIVNLRYFSPSLAIINEVNRLQQLSTNHTA